MDMKFITEGTTFVWVTKEGLKTTQKTSGQFVFKLLLPQID